MPPKKKQKTNWASSDEESSEEEISSSEEETSNDITTTDKETEEDDDQETNSSNTADQDSEKNPYLVTKSDGRFNDQTTVFVGQLPKSVTAPEIRSLFASCGDISRVVLMKFKDTGKPMGSAFVEFNLPIGAKNALKKNGENLRGRKLRVNMSNQKPSKAPIHSSIAARDRDSRLVYMGNLNFKTEREQIIQFFRHCGKIKSIDIPCWKDSGKRRGLVSFFCVIMLAITFANLRK